MREASSMISHSGPKRGSQTLKVSDLLSSRCVEIIYVCHLDHGYHRGLINRSRDLNEAYNRQVAN